MLKKDPTCVQPFMNEYVVKYGHKNTVVCRRPNRVVQHFTRICDRHSQHQVKKRI